MKRYVTTKQERTIESFDINDLHFVCAIFRDNGIVRSIRAEAGYMGNAEGAPEGTCESFFVLGSLSWEDSHVSVEDFALNADTSKYVEAFNQIVNEVTNPQE